MPGEEDTETAIASALGLAAAFAMVLVLYPLIQAPVDLAIKAGTFTDDAFFYSVIAERLAAGGPPSLDGIHPTNGFQPLWMALLVALKLVLPGQAAIALLAWASYGALVVAAGLFAVWLLRERSAAGRVAAVLALLLTLLNINFLGRVLNGLETALLLVMLAIWLLTARAALKPSAGLLAISCWTLASGALFLTRTDLFLASMLASLVIFIRYGPGRRFWLNITLSSLMVVPYLLWNLLKFGSLVPISGRVKKFYLEMQYPTLRDYLASDEWQGLPDLFADIWGWGAVAMVLAALYVLARPGLRRGLPGELKLLVVIVVLHILFLQIVHRELRPHTNYYFVPEAVTVTLLVAYGLRRAIVAWLPGLAAPNRWAGGLFVVVLIGFAAVFTAPAPKAKDYWSGRVALGEAINRIVPEGAKVGAFWPGLFAHVADRPVVPLDGIISSPEYFSDVVRAGRELDYAQEIGIEYLAVLLPGWYDFEAPMARAPRWSELYLKRLADARHLRFDPVAAEVFSANGDRWALLRIREAGE